ncbi:hypothetical protein Tco_1154622 [Tanacetum coccineum]
MPTAHTSNALPPPPSEIATITTISNDGTMCTWQRAVGGRSNVRLTKSWTPAPNSFFHRRGYVSRGMLHGYMVHGAQEMGIEVIDVPKKGAGKHPRGDNI